MDNAILNDFGAGAGFTGEQIAKMKAEQEIMSRPDTDPEKVALIFQRARGQNERL